MAHTHPEPNPGNAPMEVSETARNSATQCPNGYSCLMGETECMCELEYTVDGDIHFVRGNDDTICPYRRSFGDGHFCTCPVRKEIFNKYRR